MTNLDRSIHRVRVAAFLFGVPLAGSVAGLTFSSAFTQVFIVQAEVLEIVAATAALGLLVVMFAGWIADQHALPAQACELHERASELKLKHQELEAKLTQHALELRIKEQELQKEIGVREERVKFRDLEHSVRLRRLATEGPTGDQRIASTTKKPT